MAAVLAAYDIVAAEIERSGGALIIAAYNGPEHYVVSGPRAAVKAALAHLETAGVETKPLRVSYAAHSSLIDPVLPAFEKVLETVEFKPPRVTLISNVTGFARWGRGDGRFRVLANPNARASPICKIDINAGGAGRHAFRRSRSAPGAARYGCRMHPRRRPSSGCRRCAATGRTGRIFWKACSDFTSAALISIGSDSTRLFASTSRTAELPVSSTSALD